MKGTDKSRKRKDAELQDKRANQKQPFRGMNCDRYTTGKSKAIREMCAVCKYGVFARTSRDASGDAGSNSARRVKYVRSNRLSASKSPAHFFRPHSYSKPTHTSPVTLCYGKHKTSTSKFKTYGMNRKLKIKNECYSKKLLLKYFSKNVKNRIGWTTWVSCFCIA